VFSTIIPKRLLKVSGITAVRIRNTVDKINKIKKAILSGLPKKFIAAYKSIIASPP